MATTRQDLDVSELRLDPTNPRLPEDEQGGSQHALLRYLYDNAALDELIRSLADNEYFQHEPIIAVRTNGHYTVLEGNRRLSALKILLREPEAEEEGIEPGLDDPVPAEQLERMRNVPTYVVDTAQEVHQYLGFRHIGGIKTWSAEAKARYLHGETEREVAAGSDHPFRDVARRVGSNALGVRNSYLALQLLRHARDEFGVSVNYVMEERFGVWLRCMNAEDVRRYIGLGSPRSYEEVQQQVAETKRDEMAEVIGDLTRRGGQRAVLSDSRDVTVYGLILHNPVAHRALRAYDDMTIPKQIVSLAELPQRLRSLRDQIDVANQEAQQADVDQDLLIEAEGLAASARSLRSTIRDRLEDNDGD